MNTMQLLDSLLPDTSNDAHDMRAELSAWMTASSRFASFCDDNRDKIRKKFKNALTKEDRRDVQAELEIAKRIVEDSEFVPTYEPFGTTVKGPDFKIASNLDDFYVEVKRIRESHSVCAIHEFKSRIREAVRAIDSPFGVWIDLCGDDGDSIAVDGLLPAVESVVEELSDRLNDCRSTLACGSTASYRSTSIPEFKFTIDHLRDKQPDSPTAWFDGAYSIPFTQRESFKFSDLLFRTLEQCKPDLPNVLIVRCTSTTHDAQNFFDSLHKIGERVVENDTGFFESKELTNISEFRERFKLLSNVFVVCDWPDPINNDRTTSWRNPVASSSISEQSFGRLTQTMQ